MEQSMAYNQEGTVKEYCDSFQILFDQVRIREEISEFYAIYLFICGLEPEIRKIFARWHQYSCTKVKDVISLAIKIDSNGLQDSFSPFDPNSSFYNKDLEFDINITLEELMKDNEFFQNGKIQETCDNIVQETIIYEVIDYVHKKIEDEFIQDECSEDKLYGEMSKGVGNVIQEAFDSDQVINEDMGGISIKGFQGNEKDNKNNQVQIGEKGNVVESTKCIITVGEWNACVGLKLLYFPQNSHYITGESMSVYGFVLYKGAGSFHCVKQSKGSINSASSQVCVLTGIGVEFPCYVKQFKWIDTGWVCYIRLRVGIWKDTGWACNLKCKDGQSIEFKMIRGCDDAMPSGFISFEQVVLQKKLFIIDYHKLPLLYVNRVITVRCFRYSLIGLKDATRISIEFRTNLWGMYHLGWHLSGTKEGLQVMLNVKEFNDGFVKSSIEMALFKRWLVYLSTKNTLQIILEGRPMDNFQGIYKEDWKERFEHLIWHEHWLIKDMMAYVIKSGGGYIWECKNYVGDVKNDLLTQGLDSLGLMTSVLRSSYGKVLEARAVQETINLYIEQHKKGTQMRTNINFSILTGITQTEYCKMQDIVIKKRWHVDMDPTQIVYDSEFFKDLLQFNPSRSDETQKYFQFTFDSYD